MYFAANPPKWTSSKLHVSRAPRKLAATHTTLVGLARFQRRTKQATMHTALRMIHSRRRRPSTAPARCEWDAPRRPPNAGCCTGPSSLFRRRASASASARSEPEAELRWPVADAEDTAAASTREPAGTDEGPESECGADTGGEFRARRCWGAERDIVQSFLAGEGEVGERSLSERETGQRVVEEPGTHWHFQHSGAQPCDEMDAFAAVKRSITRGWVCMDNEAVLVISGGGECWVVVVSAGCCFGAVTCLSHGKYDISSTSLLHPLRLGHLSPLRLACLRVLHLLVRNWEQGVAWVNASGSTDDIPSSDVAKTTPSSLAAVER